MKKLVIFSFIFLSTAAFALDVPYLGGRINDTASLLSDQKRGELENLLKQYETSTTNQLVVLTIPSLEGEDIEQYSIKVAEKWKIGQKGKDNGVILLIAKNDQAMRIEVGYGLESVLTDLKSGRIISQVIAPEFKNGNFDAGIECGLNSIIDVIGGSDSSITQTEISPAASMIGSGIEIMTIILISLFVFGILGVFTFLGLLAPGFAGWFLYLFLFPFYSAFPIALYGQTPGIAIFTTYAISFPFIRHFLGQSAFGKKAAKWVRASGRSSSRSSFGSSHSSSGFSHSSFSGGGGSFGGGGASGKW